MLPGTSITAFMLLCHTIIKQFQLSDCQIVAHLVTMGLVNGIGLRLTLCGLLTIRVLVSGDMPSPQLGQKECY